MTQSAMSLQAFSGVVLLIATVAAHSNLLVPNPRNAIDRDLPQFANGQFPLVNGSAGCTPTTSVCGCWCTNGTSVCESAQTCLFFSQGCSIGCPTCDGVSSRNQTEYVEVAWQLRYVIHDYEHTTETRRATHLMMSTSTTLGAHRAKLPCLMSVGKLVR